VSAHRMQAATGKGPATHDPKSQVGATGHFHQCCLVMMKNSAVPGVLCMCWVEEWVGGWGRWNERGGSRRVCVGGLPEEEGKNARVCRGLEDRSSKSVELTAACGAHASILPLISMVKNRKERRRWACAVKGGKMPAEIG